MSGVIRTLHWFGELSLQQMRAGLLAWKLLAEVIMRTGQRPWRWKEILHAIVQNGIGSLPIIVVSTAFAGLVITGEIAWHMDTALHTISMIPGFTAQFVIRELGIAITSLLLVAKVGASITAEVATMKVTDQIDALRLLGIDPVSYLVFPRWIASILSTACLALISIAVTVGCALVMSVLQFNFNAQEYVNALRHFVGPMDFVSVIVKSLIYGAVIPVISCAYGFQCKGGAQGVGMATAHAVVASTITIIILDFILTFAFSWVL